MTVIKICSFVLNVFKMADSAKKINDFPSREFGDNFFLRSAKFIAQGIAVKEKKLVLRMSVSKGRRSRKPEMPERSRVIQKGKTSCASPEHCCKAASLAYARKCNNFAMLISRREKS